MIEYLIRHYSQCPKVDINKPPTVDALKLLSEREPKEAETLRTLLSNPAIDFYRLVTPAQTKGRYAVHYIRFPEGQDFPAHTHDDVFALLFIAEGKGYVLLNGNKHPVQVGDVLYVPPGTSHAIVAEGGPLAYLACVSPDLTQDGRADIHLD